MDEISEIELRIINIAKTIDLQRAKLAQLRREEESIKSQVESEILSGSGELSIRQLDDIKSQIAAAEMAIEQGQQLLAKAQADLQEIRRKQEFAGVGEFLNTVDRELLEIEKAAKDLEGRAKRLRESYLHTRYQTLVNKYSMDASIRLGKIDWLCVHLIDDLKSPLETLGLLIRGGAHW